MIQYAATTLPVEHFSHNLISWKIENDLIHIYMEEPWGIQNMDLRLVLALNEDGVFTSDENSVLESVAVNYDTGEEHPVESWAAAELLETLLIPVISEEFPNIDF